MAKPIGDYNVSQTVRMVDVARCQMGMDVVTLCKMAGITTITYYHWMEGIRSPNLYTLEAVLKVLGLKLALVEEEE